MRYPIHPKAVAIIKQYESLHDGDLAEIGLQPKECPAGIWTVGWGHALRDPITKEWLKGSEGKRKAYAVYHTLTEVQAEQLLMDDLKEFSEALAKRVQVPITSEQFGALISLTYNIGIGAMSTSTLLRKLNLRDYQGAANEFPRWNKSGGRVLRGLVLRRQKERYLFLEGTH